MGEPSRSLQTNQSPSHWGHIGTRTEEILNVRAELAKQRTQLPRLIEDLGRGMTHPAFFMALLAGHLLWILLNLPVYPWWTPWDPYPFIFLATLASAEAPFLTLLVLMFQHRNQRIAELREETNLQVSLHAERQLSMTLRILGEIQQRLNIDSQQDPELLRHLQQELDARQLLDNLRRELRQSEGGDEATAP